MSELQIDGYGRDNGRRRRRKYQANDADDAIIQASADGTITETVRQLADLPASDRQKAYATALGIEFPADISSDAISKLIDAAVERELNPVEELARLAARRRVARITYWKHGEDWPTVRLVEPYELTGDVSVTSNGSISATLVKRLFVHCWQIEPAPADGERWRSFDPDHIKSVKDGGRAFAPRAEITIHTGTIRPAS